VPKKRVAILGSTGSIGRQAIDILGLRDDEFEVRGLAAGSNVALLAEQARRFRPQVLSVSSRDLASDLDGALGQDRTARIEYGDAGLCAVAAASGADIVLAATDGMAALRAVFAAVEAGIDVALANKEIAVSAGEPLFAAAERSGAAIVPVDSEHNAIQQCLAGESRDDVVEIAITASGGPCWEMTPAQLETVTPELALRHPTWPMGRKNSLDSATMMNKGLEVIEATHFFKMPASRFRIVVHRQSVVHAMVFFKDGSVKAQLAAPDMRLPIGNALAYPLRLDDHRAVYEKTRNAVGVRAPVRLTLEPMDDVRFPAVALAYAAAERGGTFPAVLSASNEEAGRAFLQGKIKFVDIVALVATALDAHASAPATLEEIEAADRWARSFTRDATGAGV
jgi:1-deoxy-D-xylulose-5-phosphate reductoisomerase